MASVILQTVAPVLEATALSAAAKTLLVLGTKTRLLAAAEGLGVAAHVACGVSFGDVASGCDSGGRATTLAVVGGGARPSRHFGGVRGDVLHELAHKHAAARAGDADVVVLLDDAAPAAVASAALAVARAFPLFSRRTPPPPPRAVRVHLVTPPGSAPAAPAAVRRLQTLVDSVRAAARLVDTPPNELNPTTYVDAVRRVHAESLAAAGVSLEVIQGTELRDRGYGAIWNVGKASEHLPALVILSHRPAGAKKSVAWVGKGITFDTGGLAIKTKEGMPTMKVDMGGSAGVFHGFVATILTEPPQNYSLHAILCIAENSVDERSFRPDDIISSYSGKTIEVNNTDAEGRLVLCDGVAHACKHLDADVIVDMATLTGAQAYATGLRHGGVLSNQESFESLVVSSGRESGDLAYPLIFCPELIGISTLMKSEVADMKNSASDRSNAPSTGAGMFVHAHLSPEDKWAEGGEGWWAHIDMAYPVTVGARGTGWGVGLLTTLAQKLEQQFSS